MQQGSMFKSQQVVFVFTPLQVGHAIASLTIKTILLFQKAKQILNRLALLFIFYHIALMGGNF